MRQISAIIGCLGFYKRAAAVQRFSRDYIEKQVQQRMSVHHHRVVSSQSAIRKPLHPSSVTSVGLKPRAYFENV